MSRDTPFEPPAIQPGMTILDVVSRYRRTEAVFKRYDESAGVCLCCQALFDTLQDVAEQYGLDLEQLTEELQTAASQSPSTGHRDDPPA